MDHKEAVQTMAAERYLLNEFAPEERDAFEEHFFSCDECALDIKTGAALMEQGKSVFLHERRDSPVPIPTAVRPASVESKDWFAWLRPAFAVPAMAMLLLVVGFQNFIQVPSLERSLTAANAPEVLPNAYLASGSARGGEEHVVTAKAGQPALLLIDIPGKDNAAYTAELYDSSDKKMWSLPIPEDAMKENLTVRIPGNQEAGTYSLVVKSADSAASAEVSRYRFTLHRQ